MLIKGEVVFVEGDSLCAMIISKGTVLEMEYDRNDKELYNFKTGETLKKHKAPFDFDPFSNLNVNAILKKWCHFPRMAKDGEHRGGLPSS